MRRSALHNLLMLGELTLEYWVVMNKRELQISLLLLNKTRLPGVVETGGEFQPEESDLRTMVEKGFFETGESGTAWNPFVKTVLWSAANAQSELWIDGRDGTMLRLYFHNETMILLAGEPENERYVFYYVPLLPKAIGGLARNLERLEAVMPPNAGGETRTVPLPPELSGDSEWLSAIPGQTENGPVPLTVSGWSLGGRTLERALVETEEGFWSVSREDGQLQLSAAGFFDFLQEISRWIVRTHGQSLKMKETNDG